MSVAWAVGRGSFYRPAPAAGTPTGPHAAPAARSRLFSRNAVMHVGLSWAVTAIPLLGTVAVVVASNR
ncbi:hypothetical protein [Catellatospora sp. IY07-71]|uniref:hypothetical protein n=1 Tax=Catellatospora sp. IY07-71 TaxID=2728827 RepID=UPI001BB454CB|nr:hypothetical protein [Catellatospora sp. IY07-71]